LVFVHGIGQNQTVWKAYAKHFSKRYRCLTYDCRGHGKSQYKKISIDNLADDLYKLLQAENIAKASLVGYSLGTQIATRFWEKYPKMVDKLILIGLFTPQTFKLSQKIIALPIFHLLRFTFKLPYFFGIRRHLYSYNDYSVCYRKKIYGMRAVIFPFVYVVPWRDFAGMHLSAYFDTLGVILKYKPPLSCLSVPSLVLQSAEDFFISFQRCIDYLKNNPNVVMDFIDADHLIIRRKPEICIKKIEKFLERGLEY